MDSDLLAPDLFVHLNYVGQLPFLSLRSSLLFWFLYLFVSLFPIHMIYDLVGPHSLREGFLQALLCLTCFDENILCFPLLAM